MKTFKEKGVIVTGASSGIGEAMAREFAAQGARVVLGARSVQKLQLIAGEIRSQGGQAAYCPGFTASNVRFSALTADGSAQGETPRNEAKMMTSAEVARIVARGVLKRKRLCLMESEGRATHFVKKFAPGFLDRMFYLVMSKEPDSPLK